MSNRKFVDRTGQVYGQLLVLHRLPNNAYSHVVWECLCACGDTTVVTANNLVKTKSCGCLLAPICAETHTTHGLRHTSEYNSWRGIKQRCYNKNSNGYYLY